MGGVGGGSRRMSARQIDGVVVYCGASVVPVPLRWDWTTRPAAFALRAITDGSACVRCADGAARAMVVVLGDEALTGLLAARIARRHFVGGVRLVGAVRRLMIEAAFALRDAAIGEIVSEVRAEAAVARACRELAFPQPEDVGHSERCGEAARIAEALVRAPPMAAVREAAAQLGMAPRVLRDRCVELTGKPPRELRTAEVIRRIAHARRSGWTIERIAAELGYADGPTMLRATRRAQGASSVRESREPRA